MLVAARKPKTWDERLRELREELGLTQKQAAEAAGVTERTWSSWENRQRTPSRMTQRILKQIFPQLS